MHDERHLGEGAELILGKRLVFQPGETEAQGLCVQSGEEGRADPTSRCGDRNRPGVLWGTQPWKTSRRGGARWGSSRGLLEKDLSLPCPPPLEQARSPILSSRLVTRNFWGPGSSCLVLTKEAISWGPQTAPSCPYSSPISLGPSSSPPWVTEGPYALPSLGTMLPASSAPSP